jgi:hypothetical protein
VLSSVRFPSNGGGDLIFIKSFEDDAISLSGLVGLVSLGSGFGGVKGLVNVGFGGSNMDVRVKRSGMGAGFTIGFGSKDKVSITSAAFSAKVSCSTVGMTTSSASAYSRPVSSSFSSKGSSFSSSGSDSPDGSALSL